MRVLSVMGNLKIDIRALNSAYLLLVSAIAGFTLATSTGAGAAESSSGGSFPVYVNSVEIIMESRAAAKDGEIFVPLTDTLATAIGATVETESDNNLMTAVVMAPGSVVAFSEGSAFYKVGEEQRTLRLAPFVSGGILYVPSIAFFSEFGFDVLFRDGALRAEKTGSASFLSQIPDSIFAAVEPEQPAHITAIETPSQVVSTSQAQPFQYTYDNSFEFLNIAVSGDRALSNLIPESNHYNKFNIRSQGVLANGYETTIALRTSSTTNDDLRHGEVNNLAISSVKGGASLKLYDINPKISRFVMKNYQLQGMAYSRKTGDMTYTAMTGMTPKRLFESLYNRHVDMERIERKNGSKWSYAATRARIRDGGGLQVSERMDNRVASVTADYKTKELDFGAEFAMSGARIYSGPEIKANGLRAELKRTNGRIVFMGFYERIGNDFVSESAFFTSGRREYSGIFNIRHNRRTTVMTGVRNVALMGESTYYFPFQINSQPFGARPKMKLTLNMNSEKSRSVQGSKRSDTRNIGVSDWFGETKVSINNERRVQRSYAGDTNVRTNIKTQVNSQLTERLALTHQWRKEVKRPNAKPLSRFQRARLEYRLSEWTDAGIAFESYYNGTDFNRKAVEMDYRLLDNENDREITVTYGFFDYDRHNDSSLSLKFAYTR